jgi:hypothetical protein
VELAALGPEQAIFLKARNGFSNPNFETLRKPQLVHVWGCTPNQLEGAQKATAYLALAGLQPLPAKAQQAVEKGFNKVQLNTVPDSSTYANQQHSSAHT